MMKISDPKLDLTQSIIAQLQSFGVHSAHQFVNLCDIDIKGMSKFLNVDALVVRQRVAKHLPAPDGSLISRRVPIPPMGGAVIPSDSAGAMPAARSDDAMAKEKLTAVVEGLSDLPDRVGLESYMAPVFSQHQSGTCVGQAIAAWRGFFCKCAAYSGEFSYVIAKKRDGLPECTEGTFVWAGYESAYLTGALPKANYSYEDFIGGIDHRPLVPGAALAKIGGYSDLLAGLQRFDLFPKLLCAVLSGQLIPGVGPRPVVISTPVFDSMMTNYVRDTGVMHLPLPFEVSRGGHAWVISGYTMGSHDSAPGGQDFFHVRNSWSPGWARNSPVAPGHAMIPMRFFQDHTHIYEAFLGLAEDGPIKGPITASNQKEMNQ